MKKQKTKEQKKKERQNTLFFCYIIYLLSIILILSSAGFGVFFILVLGKNSVMGSIFNSLIFSVGYGYIFFGMLITWYEDQYNKIK